MNTLELRTVPLMKQTRRRDYVILLDDLEFGMSKEQLREITDLHNEGMKYEDISERVQRHPVEVIVALLHQAKDNRVNLKPFAYREMTN